jgi:hypothetical protein
MTRCIFTIAEFLLASESLSRFPPIVSFNAEV